ncbi:unnamed protein product [Acanthoscelides obtectus]|uniref:Rab3 GTPase-activating protein non-catalytic subunit n=1 Tax=Acanthoscelides obtectus TaxID=200917 RepID=A0A9P0LRF8_ACAOB|nr:unnamed protein product [Acanthoscelides obtectus]CAK1620373.1 Rab3 GTPase-activating protein regulatory subunit [Acanthoscelides obtectus]
MSCQIRLSGNIQDVSEIRRILFPTDDHRGSDSWLQVCEASVSPTGDLIVIAHERKIIVLSAKWNPQLSANHYVITYSGTIHDYDKVKAVLCLPVVGENQHSQIGPDWTCIVVGYDSGYVRFYTENCELLLDEQFHSENIKSVKCQSQHSPRPDISPDLRLEEIYIQYQSCVCILGGSQIFPHLRSARNDGVKGPPLPPSCLKKWSIHDQSLVNDTAVVGLCPTSSFDHLLTASTCGGFDAVYRAAPPAASLVIAAGSRPFLGWHYVSEGAAQPALGDVAKVVATRIKSALPDAQCSFIQVPDEKKSKHRHGNKVAHFLLIYSPKKGTLEIFSLLQGSKICTFTASKFSRLFNINYGLMGFNSTTSKSRYVCQWTSVFIDNDGQIKEIMVPYHFALAEKNNKRSRDIHLYKKLRHYIKSGDYNEETLLKESYDICTELKTLEIKSQIVDMLISNRNIPANVILKCAKYFVENAADDEGINFRILCDNISHLLELYLFVANKQNGDNDETENSSLKLDEKDMTNLQKLLDLSIDSDSKELPEVHVRFSDKNLAFSTSEFLSGFDFTNVELVTLKDKVDDGILFKTSEVLLKPYITGELSSFAQLESLLIKAKIDTKNLFCMLVNYWVNRSLHINLNLEKEMNNFLHLCYTLLRTASKEDTVCNYNQVSTFWSKIRETLANSSRPFPALMAAILCKTAAHKVNIEKQMEDSSISLEEESMEVLSQESVLWSLLIGKLEDISLLNIIMSTKALAKDAALPKLQHDKIDVSLKYILEKGRGAVSEIVARWLSSSGIDPQLIVLNEMTEKEEENIESEKILDQLNLLKEQFPYSLNSSALLANLAWEYALDWQKEIQDFSKLEAAMKCLGCIQNVQVKQGMYQLLWNTHLKIVNESTCKLINKVGKLPKERLCRQDTGLSDAQITIFLGITSDFLDAFMDVTQTACSPHPLQFENIWENGGQPLVELAAQQKQANYDLLHLHYQLSMVLQMITTFGVKHSKPVNNLFEASVVNVLFTDFARNVEVSWNKSDIKINASRTQFLFKVISASIESITINESGKIYSTQHVTWMAKCLSLARFWNLDVDLFKRYQITKLYINGFDSLSEELIPSINDRNELGKNLLMVGAKRMSQYLTKSPDFSNNIAALSPALTNYMDSLDDEWCAPCPMEKITALATYIVQCINEDQIEHRLAQLLLEASMTIGELKS